MTEEYIRLFEGLMKRITKLVIEKEIEEKLNKILERVIQDMGEIWSYYKKKEFNISETEKKEFSWKLEKYQLELNNLVKQYKIQKKCSKCKKDLLATTKNFYIDRSRKGGLSVVCKQCIKENYRSKKKRG